MLQFINENGVLFSGIFAIIAALISALVAIIIDNRKNKKDSIAAMRKELEKTKAELEAYTSIAEQEKYIDKSTGSIYVETLPNGKTRKICGYCWENNHTKMPLITDSYYDEEERKRVVYGKCGSCKASCYEE